MKFDMVAPCKDCPFRSDIRGYLRPARVREIVANMIERQASFSCHKTTREGGADGKDEQHCAGALIFLERMNRPNQMMRWMERLGAYDRRKLQMDAPVFKTLREMVAAQPSAKRTKAHQDPTAPASDASPSVTGA